MGTTTQNPSRILAGIKCFVAFIVFLIMGTWDFLFSWGKNDDDDGGKKYPEAKIPHGTMTEWEEK